MARPKKHEPSKRADSKKKMKCPHCEHTWYSRVDNPLQCPACKRQLRPPKKKNSGKK